MQPNLSRKFIPITERYSTRNPAGTSEGEEHILSAYSGRATPYSIARNVIGPKYQHEFVSTSTSYVDTGLFYAARQITVTRQKLAGTARRIYKSKCYYPALDIPIEVYVSYRCIIHGICGCENDCKFWPPGATWNDLSLCVDDARVLPRRGRVLHRSGLAPRRLVSSRLALN